MSGEFRELSCTMTLEHFGGLVAFDNLCKLLAEKYPERFALWLLGEVPASLQVLKSELSIEPIRADAVTFLGTGNRILHVEFQVKVETEPPIPLWVLDYWVRLYRLYRLPIDQVVIFLKPPPPDTVIESAFILEQTHHQYRVVKMWEQDPALFLGDPALLPLATLAATDNPSGLLYQVAEQVSMIEIESQQREVAAYSQLLAGLKFDKQLIQQVFRSEAMQESVIYQEILQQGELKGQQEATEGLLLAKFSELDNELRLIVPQLVALSSSERSRLILQFSREDLLAHFTPPS
jgi:predicted transposase YdaD